MRGKDEEHPKKPSVTVRLELTTTVGHEDGIQLAPSYVYVLPFFRLAKFKGFTPL